jgi:PDZ domain-containing protein
VTERTDTTVETRADSPRGDQRADRGLTRRTWTLVFSFGLVIVLGLLGSFVRVPYVALGPGPTYDTLHRAAGSQVVDIKGTRTYPVAGQLRMTTVSLMDDITLFGALGLWLSGREALAPREEYFQPGETRQQVEQRNVQQFQNSQSLAEVAALRYLGYPMQVRADQVVSGSPAAKVIKAGDRILAVNGKQLTRADAVFNALRNTKPGDTVALTLQGERGPARTERITLTSRPDRKQGFLGITPIDHANVNFDVKISLADVGGPSAGLTFALAIVDKLTPGELNGGKAVAGTGEIDQDGKVGPIGGIEFKLIAAREAGATAFLTPAENCDEAKANVPDGLRLLKVNTLGDAVKSLKELAAGKQPPGC